MIAPTPRFWLITSPYSKIGGTSLLIPSPPPHFSYLPTVLLVEMNCITAMPTRTNGQKRKIKAKQMLPINRFAYGPLIFVNGQANVQIGKLICYGTKPTKPFLYIPMRSHLVFFYGLSGNDQLSKGNRLKQFQNWDNWPRIALKIIRLCHYKTYSLFL